MYEIDLSTLMLMGLDNNKTRVITLDDEFIIDFDSKKIVDNSCKFFGSCLNDRVNMTKRLINIKSKSPIIIEESRNIIFFPTSSTRTKQSTWIALNKIKEISKKEHQNSEILFKNQDTLDLDISVNSLENQIVRATMLKSKLYERKLEEKN